MRTIPNVVWGVVWGIVGATQFCCAGGVDHDGATTFARPDSGKGDDLDEGGTGDDEGDEGTTGDPKAGGVSDSSDPSMDTGAPAPDDPGAGDDGGAAPQQPSEPPPQQPPQQPGQAAPCEGMCAAYDACGIEPFANCAAIECVSEDNGGPCDQALLALQVCVASLPDCGSVSAYFNGFDGVYPCMDHDANVAFACGF